MRVIMLPLFAISIAIASVLGSTPALAANNGEDELDSIIQELVGMNPGASAADIRADLQREAQASKKSTLKVAREARAEARKHRSEFASSMSRASNATKAAPRASRTGDIIYSPTSRAGVAYGHTAIYTDGGFYAVEAQGPGKRSRGTAYYNVKVASKSKLMYVKTTQAKRNQAAARAKTYKNRVYRIAFHANKTESGAMNCSQLVWAAYKYSGARIDLDFNGGPGVYPSDILNSAHTVTYFTMR